MSPRRIKVTSETFDFSSDTSVDYLDLPADWDDRTRDDKDAFLQSAAMAALETRAGSGAWVVDENDEEID